MKKSQFIRPPNPSLLPTGGGQRQHGGHEEGDGGRDDFAGKNDPGQQGSDCERVNEKSLSQLSDSINGGHHTTFHMYHLVCKRRKIITRLHTNNEWLVYQMVPAGTWVLYPWLTSFYCAIRLSRRLTTIVLPYGIIHRLTELR